jgi:hypothetical protein
MRQIDTDILTRIIKNVQTEQNNNTPRVEVIVSRARAPIARAEHWQECIVAESTTATVTSVAVKKTGREISDIYAAYIAGGVLTVKKAKFVIPLRKMQWQTVATIPNAVACAVEFDGRFERHGRFVEYRTDSVPWIFYTTTTGELWGGILGGTMEILSASGAAQIDVVRGISGAYGDISQGLAVFYVTSSGAVKYRQIINGEWAGEQTVSIAPANAVYIKAERLFDYRICLQVQCADYSLWEIFTKMEASGWNGTENIDAVITAKNVLMRIHFDEERVTEYLHSSISADNAILYAFSPILVFAENIDRGDGDKGYKVRATFDERVYDPMCGFTLTDSASGAWSCTSVVKVSDKVLEIDFLNFNNAVGECTLAYTPGTIMGDVVPLEADSIEFTPSGLVPFAIEPPVPLTIENIQDWSGSL